MVVVALLVVVAFFGMIIGKWYHTAAMETIAPQRGVYGMDGLEIWIDINARMPAFARDWGCKTLRGREAVVLGGQNTMAPYSCQEGFGILPDLAAYDSIVKANLDQYAAGLSAEKAQGLRRCFDGKMAVAVTPEDIAAVNASVVGDAAKKVIVAVSESARTCKSELGS